MEAEQFEFDLDDENDEGDREDKIRLAISDVAAVDALNGVLVANTVLRYVNFVGDFMNIPVVPACTYPARTSYIPASVAPRRDDLTMAQMAAFLSGLRDGDNIAACAFDSNIVRLIFAFHYKAPNVLREIYV